MLTGTHVTATAYLLRSACILIVLSMPEKTIAWIGYNPLQ